MLLMFKISIFFLLVYSYPYFQGSAQVQPSIKNNYWLFQLCTCVFVYELLLHIFPQSHIALLYYLILSCGVCIVFVYETRLWSRISYNSVLSRTLLDYKSSSMTICLINNIQIRAKKISGQITILALYLTYKPCFKCYRKLKSHNQSVNWVFVNPQLYK